MSASDRRSESSSTGSRLRREADRNVAPPLCDELAAQVVNATSVEMNTKVISPLYLPAEVSRRMTEDAVRAYPNECCGILFGRDESRGRIIDRLQPVQNVVAADQRVRRFAIEPLVLMRAEREAADARLAVIGFYHSHPDHPARPSAHDREKAWPFYSYIIISVQKGDAVDVTSWVLDDETRTFQRQDIVEAVD